MFTIVYVNNLFLVNCPILLKMSMFCLPSFFQTLNGNIMWEDCAKVLYWSVFCKVYFSCLILVKKTSLKSFQNRSVVLFHRTFFSSIKIAIFRNFNHVQRSKEEKKTFQTIVDKIFRNISIFLYRFDSTQVVPPILCKKDCIWVASQVAERLKGDMRPKFNPVFMSDFY